MSQEGGGSRPQQSHYFAKLFSRWRNEGVSATSSRPIENEVDVGHARTVGSSQQSSRARPSASYSFPESELTPQILRRARWKLDSKPKAKLQSLDAVLQPHAVHLLAEPPRSAEMDQVSSTSSPPPSPAVASLVESSSSEHRPPSQSSWRANATDISQLRQQQQQSELAALGSARSDTSNTSASSFEFGQLDNPHALDFITSSTLVDTIATTAASTTTTSAAVVGEGSRTSTGGAFYGLMDVRLPKFPLKKLRQKQQSFVDQAVWKPTENCCWRSTSGVCLRLRGARLERLAVVERQALQKLALTHLQKANLGCAILRPKDSLPLRQKRHKYIKRKAHTVNVVEKKDGASAATTGILATGNRKSPSPLGSGQQVFGIPLSQCIENEQQWEWAQQESVAAASAPTVTSSPPVSSTSQVANSSGLHQQHQQPAQAFRQQHLQHHYHQTTSSIPHGHQHPLPSTSSSSSGVGTSTSGAGTSSNSQQQPINRHMQQLTDEQKQRCQSLDLDEMEFLNVARASPQRLSGESSKSSLSDQASSDSLLIKPGYSKTSLNNQTSAEDTPSSDRRYASSDSLLGSPSWQYSPRYMTPTYGLPKQDSCEPHYPRVPKVVQACTEYLSQRGLQTIGIFRVAGSAKRCRQLRLNLDSGHEIVLNEDQTEIYPHDIATLLKEYFRDLPDPLLTKELYAPFIATAKFQEDARVELLRYLISLLPLANCDTLLVLLQFLRRVAKHSYDTINDQGVSTSGNKMNAHNLATVFGPTILRQTGGKLTQTYTENEAVIKVMETMIERCDDLFTIPPALQDALYRSLCETDADALDLILNRVASEVERQVEEQEEETQTAVYFSSQEELDPPSMSKDSDGTTVIRTRQKTTHRIIYKIHKPTGRILGSNRLDEPSSSSSQPMSSGDFPAKVAALVNEKFPELSLFTEDDEENGTGVGSRVDEAPDLIDLTSMNTAAVLVGSPSTSRALALNTLSKPPTRKLTPLAKLTETIRSSSARK